MGLVTLGFAIALDFLPTLRYPEHGRRVAALRQLRAEMPKRPVVIVIGSSRTQHGVNPAAMGFSDEPGSPLVFNYGLAGALPGHLALALPRIQREAGIKPAAVVVEIFPALLDHNDLLHTGYADKGSRLTVAEMIEVRSAVPDSKIQRQWVESRLFGCFRFRNDVMCAICEEWVSWEGLNSNLQGQPDQFGFTPLSPPDVDRIRAKERQKAFATYAGQCQNLQPSTLAEQSYRKIVADCRSTGVPVAFYLTPESPTFRSWYSPRSHAALAAFIQMLTDELGVPVFDFSNGWTEEDFLDDHHLLPTGAERFSRRFADEALRPWFQTNLLHPDKRIPDHFASYHK